MNGFAANMIQRLGGRLGRHDPVGAITAPDDGAYRAVTHGDFDNSARYRAQSILNGVECRDGDGPLLPFEQACDVLRWAGVA